MNGTLGVQYHFNETSLGLPLLLKFGSERVKYYTSIKGAVARNWDHYTFWKPPTNPSAKPNLTLSSHFGKNVGLGKG